MSPSQLLNYASTTDSGKKTGSGDRTSGASTQVTNGHGELSQFYSPPRSSGEDDGQLPDTQDPMGSQEGWAHGSQVHGQGHGQGMAQYSQPSTQASNFQSTPALSQGTGGATGGSGSGHGSGSQQLQFPSMHSDNELASTAGTGGTSSQSQRDVEVEEAALRGLLGVMVKQTEGFSVEELEMVYRECMDLLWRERGVGDRRVVLGMVEGVFGETVRDVRGAREGFVEEAGEDE